MKSLFLSVSSFPFIYVIILLSIHLPLYLNENEEQYTNCGHLFSCGNISGVGYPFWGGDRPKECGYPGLKLKCDDGVAYIEIKHIEYLILWIDQDTQTLTIARKDLMDNLCLAKFINTTLDTSLFDYVPGHWYLRLLYGCPPLPFDLRIPGQFNCSIKGINNTYGYAVPGVGLDLDLDLGICHNIIFVPIQFNFLDHLGESRGLNQIIAEGFQVRWVVDNKPCKECKVSNGVCGYDHQFDKFICLCPDGSHASGMCASFPIDEQRPLQASPDAFGGKSRVKKTIVIVIPVVGAVVVAISIGWLVFFCRQRRKWMAIRSSQTQSKEFQTSPSNTSLVSPHAAAFTQSIPSYPSSLSNFGKGSSYFGVQLFSYPDLEKATDNFNPSRELGEGGFGTVYHGQLNDGRVVAVKRLYENNCKRVEQFMNELEILTRLQHRNLVTLYGCTSRRSRELILVYEYIPNGTVADHLHGKRAKSGLLSWPVRLNIAVETADALAYLHESDIVHRDVKSNNILLDSDFHVKVADFGLSRLFPNDVTHVSTAPQGTPGYVDPEYHQCYQLTEKSDVYSFGVVLIELISSLEAVDICRHRHDINLSNMAINKIQRGALHELVDPSLGFETNSSVRRMTTLVAELAFRCLQQEKDMRPTMNEVLEALRGIQNEGLSTQTVEVVDILVDDGAPLRGNPPPRSPDSANTEKWISSSSTIDSSQ